MSSVHTANGGSVSENNNEEQFGQQSPWSPNGTNSGDVPEGVVTPVPPAQQSSVWGAPPPPMQTGQDNPPGQSGQPNPSTVHGGAGAESSAPGYGYGSGGSGSSASSGKYRAPASARPPRRLNMGIFAGMGLLLLLLGIAVMAIMATRVLDSVDDATTATTPVIDDQERLIQETQEGLIGGGTDERVGTAEVCQLDEATLRTAATAYNITYGEWPSTVQEVMDSGLLEEIADDGYELSVGADDDLIITAPDHCN